MRFEIEKLREYEKLDLLKSTTHETLPLILWNYTEKTQSLCLWDEITLNCRSIITDQQGFVVSKGFSKFFNEKDFTKRYRNCRYDEKIDGSYIGLFVFNDQVIVNSRNSFSSKQIDYAKEIIHQRNFQPRPDYTYCFELVHPKNRIIVDYGDETELYFLSAFDVDNDFQETLLTSLNDFPSPKRVFCSELDINYLRKKDSFNKEGFVIVDEDGTRTKFKFDEYFSYLKNVTKISSLSIYDCLRRNQSFEDMILDRLPDEFFDWAKNVRQQLKIQYDQIEKELFNEWKEICDELNNSFDDKTLSIHLKNRTNKYQKAFYFLIYRNQDFSKLIWKMIKPEVERTSFNNSKS